MTTEKMTLERLRAVIESYGTSIPLHPGQGAHVDEWLNLVIKMSSATTPINLQSAKSAHPQHEPIGADT